MSPKARQAKGKARLQRYESLLAEEANAQIDRLEIHIPAGGRLGDVVVEASGLSKGFGDRLLIEDLDFSLPPGGIVGVVGPNGAGKTTLFRMIAGQEQPDGGSLKLGDTVELAYVDQSRAALDGEKSVWEEITDGVDRMRLGKREVSRARTSRASTSAAATSRSASAISRAASATGCISPSCCAAAPTCCCSTSPRTTSTSTRCARSRTRSSASPAARWSSAMTAGSSTASRRTCSSSRAIRTCAGSRASFEEYERWRRETLGEDAGPHRLRYKPLVRQ